MLQFGLIAGVLCVALVVVRLISRRMWKPFDETLDRIEQFKLEDEKLPTLPDSDIQEFKRLNAALDTLMKNNLASYRSQKEFTENASHELQTPLAIFQSKLDLLLQQPDLTEPQAEIIQSLYQVLTACRDSTATCYSWQKSKTTNTGNPQKSTSLKPSRSLLHTLKTSPKESL